MTGQEVYEALLNSGCDTLYHANSVKTSLSLLELGGLASRGLVHDRRLPQTSQISDRKDQEYGIWYDSFLDTHDIHSVLRRRNFYGPVMFVMSSEILLRLPEGSTVQTTRCNPTKWDGLSNIQRYFLTKDELVKGLRVGHFDHMLTIRTPHGIVPFADTLEKIVLDEPRLPDPDVGPEYEAARDAILACAARSGIRLTVERRVCDHCSCQSDYQNSNKPKRIGYFFSP